MSEPLDRPALDKIFRAARTYSYWSDREIAPDTLRELVELLRLGPTSANCQPARFRFVTTPEAKERLLKHVSSGNQDKTRAAPATAIVAYDLEFHANLPRMFPHTDAKSWFTGNDALIEETAFRNGSLQGAYMIIAARALGLDAGPMSGFDRAGVDGEFFAGTSLRSNFLCNLGYGDPSRLHDRLPRLGFEEMAEII